MGQFDVCSNNDAESRDYTPFLLALQADFLSVLATRVVAPVRPYSDRSEATVSRLHPVITMGGEEYVVVVSELAAVPIELLGAPAASASRYRTDILGALDLLTSGF